MEFSKSNLYHSDLRQAGELEILVLSKPRDSKYPGKPPYVRFRVRGSEKEYSLGLDSERVREQFGALPLGTWAKVKAVGARETAALEIVELGPSQTTGTPPRHSANIGAPALPPSSEPEAEQAPKPGLAREYRDALEVAVALVANFKARYGREPSEAERAIACTLWIEQNRNGGARRIVSEGGAR